MINFPVDAQYVTKEARDEMVLIHSKELLKAWLDMNEYHEKTKINEEDLKQFSPEIINEAEKFIKNRKQQIEEAAARGDEGVPAANVSSELTKAVNVLFALDTTKNTFKNACDKYEFFKKVIDHLKNITL